MALLNNAANATSENNRGFERRAVTRGNHAGQRVKIWMTMLSSQPGTPRLAMHQSGGVGAVPTVPRCHATRSKQIICRVAQGTALRSNIDTSNTVRPQALGSHTHLHQACECNHKQGVSSDTSTLGRATAVSAPVTEAYTTCPNTQRHSRLLMPLLLLPCLQRQPHAATISRNKRMKSCPPQSQQPHQRFSCF